MTTTTTIHRLTIRVVPEEAGYLVECSAGCALGTTAHTSTIEEAAKRASLHEFLYGPVVPEEAPAPGCHYCGAAAGRHLAVCSLNPQRYEMACQDADHVLHMSLEGECPTCWAVDRG